MKRQRDHNAIQLEHYAGPGLVSPRMQPRDSPYVRRHVERLVEVLRLRPGMRVLDVGCGLAKFTRLLRDVHDLDVEGLDLSPELLASVRTDRPDLRVHEGDLLRPPQRLASQFDAVTGFFMLHHLEDLPLAFAGVRALLRPGGKAAFVEPNAWCPLFWLQISLTPGLTWRAERGVLRMTQGRLAAALASAGLENVQYSTSGLLPPQLANTSLGIRVDRAVDGVAVLAPVRAFAVVSAARPARG